MIESFADRRTADLFAGRMPRRFPPDLVIASRRKLALLDAAVTLGALRTPPANRLEALGADRVGQHSIRINDQWRLCFVWRANNAYKVEIVDYH